MGRVSDSIVSDAILIGGRLGVLWPLVYLLPGSQLR